MSDKTSYRDILRSSSIMGSANALEYLVGLIRVKIVAVLLGPSGVGLIGLYTSVTGLLGTATGLGITSSGVREVALACSKEDQEEAARIVRILHRVCCCTGLIGWLAAIALAQPLSELLFNSDEHTWAIAILGSILLLNAISGGQKAIVQGQRRIGDIARISVISMLINTLVTIGLYYWLHDQGIVSVLVATAAVSLGVTSWFARRISIAPLQVSWKETLIRAKGLAGLGTAFMISALLTAGVDMATRTLITREYGIEAAGLYQAAWALSGLFAGFVLSAMGTDFYPRLTAIIHDHAAARRLVNEQTEIGMLLALPGLLGTLAFAPLAIRVFYSESFLPAAELLPWFLLGVFGKVLSFPLGFIQLAIGTGRWFIITEVTTVTLQIFMILWMVPRFGIISASYAFAITYLFYTLLMLWTAHRLIKLRWESRTRKIFFSAALLITCSLFSKLLMNEWGATISGTAILIAGATLCTLELTKITGKKKSPTS